MITKDSLLNHLQNGLFIRIKKSGVHGVGLFAVRDIPKGTNPFQSLLKTEYIEFTQEELENALPKNTYEMIDAYSARDENFIYIPTHGFNPIDLPYLINHSDEPNVATDVEGEHFVTLRDIKEGEELFSDFSTYHDGNEHYIKKGK